MSQHSFQLENLVASRSASPASSMLPPSSTTSAEKKRLTPPSVEESISKKSKALWTPHGVEIMLNGFIELANSGKMTDNRGFKNPDLLHVANNLAFHGHAADTRQIRTKWDDLKKSWKEWCKHLYRVSGWGRNEDGVPVNCRDVEDDYFKEHPESRVFRKRGPMYRRQLQNLLGEGFAVGGLTFSLDKNMAAVAQEDQNNVEVEVEEAQDKCQETFSNSYLSATSTPIIIAPIKTPILTQKPSVTHPHHTEDITSVLNERMLPSGTQAIMNFNQVQEWPVESALTRAITRLSEVQIVKELETRRRINLMRFIRFDDNIDIVLGLPEADLAIFAEDLLIDMDATSTSAYTIHSMNTISPARGSYFKRYEKRLSNMMDTCVGNQPQSNDR